jgi:Ca2+-transporting ATPase
MNWTQLSKTEIELELKTNLATGLSIEEANKRLEKFGPNSLPEKAPDSWALIFLRQFKSPLIYILLVSAVIIFYLDEKVDAAIILVVLLVNAIIGMVLEGRSSQVMSSLKNLSQDEATVLRGGKEIVIKETEVVVGDVLVLIEGQKISADARVIFSASLSLDESALTGESQNVHKHDAVVSSKESSVSAMHNMVFKGTAIQSGHGLAVVVGTGVNTELGKISKYILGEEVEIPLQKNIRNLSKIIIFVIVFLSPALFFLGIFSGRQAKEMFAVVVSLTVSIIPEGLPLVLTVVLASGVWRMAKKNALVKKLQAVESLGRAKILAVDKTGTITQNQMVIKKVYFGQKFYNLSGNGYEPKGAVFSDNNLPVKQNELEVAGIIASLASRASVRFLEEEQKYKVVGDPTEAAMAVLGEKLGFGREVMLEKYAEAAEIPFDYKNKFRAVYYEHNGEIFCAATGAPEVILKHSTRYIESGQIHELTESNIKVFEKVLQEFSQSGLRVVAFGYKNFLEPKKENLPNLAIKNLIFGGFYAIEDAVRPEAKESVKLAKEAGLKVVMITGDHKITAKAIATEAGIYEIGDEILTGPDIQSLSLPQLAKKIEHVSVFARVTPEDKMQIIKAYRLSGQIVAMTGDGVNDAPSLVAADLGVAMGKIGTDVAKQAADIVLLDDNLASIISAVKEGRLMYQNIKKVLAFLFSTSLGELFIIVVALVLKMPLPVTAVQILWLNLITDPFLGAALAMERKEAEMHSHKNISYSKFFVDWRMFIHMLLVGTVMTLGGLYVFNIYYPVSHAKAMTVCLTLLAVYQWFNALNCKFLNKSIFHKRLFSNKYLWLALLINIILQLLAVYNPWLSSVLKLERLSFTEWVIIIFLGLAVIIADEIRKIIYKIFEAKNIA